MIAELDSNEIFVFGSNLAGRHVGGAAKQAAEYFGAEEGVGEGITGQCYAFPTLGKLFQPLPKVLLKKSRDELYELALSMPDKRFLLTKVGCGIAGYPESMIKELFEDAPANIIKPKGW